MQVFLSHACVMCHAVRGTPAGGRTGPDLTHVGSRLTIAAGTLANTPDNMALWLTRTDRIKPGVEMPTYAWLDGQELADLVHYLEGLE